MHARADPPPPAPVCAGRVARADDGLRLGARAAARPGADHRDQQRLGARAGADGRAPRRRARRERRAARQDDPADFDLIDLPGIQSSSDEGRARTERIVREHIRPGRSDMYLLVHRFEKKCRTADAGGLVCLGDDAKGRTIGVLTHCDFVGDGESTRDREERAHLHAILVRTPDEAQVAEFGLAPLAPHGWAEADEVAGDGRHGLGRLLRIARAERLHFDSHEELRELARAGNATCDALVERLGQ
ncbi:hypothetical protein T492DRAFT_941515, partial [Pavlovales sp. CCMP2436]